MTQVPEKEAGALSAERAKADPSVAVEGTDLEEQIVVFQMGKELYALKIEYVNEIIRMQEITEIPRVPEFVEGVINLRGKVIPIIDLRKRFGLPASEETASTRIIIVAIRELMVGMIVDKVHEVLTIPGTSIEPPSPFFTSVDIEFLRGTARVEKVGKLENRLVILLNLEKILTLREQAAILELRAQE
ncbi:MAG: chemotaxis protein CheW [Armatimonadetes bacterium]|nr:chemotaxis protein CheW [Armatimonadota bacterium]